MIVEVKNSKIWEQNEWVNSQCSSWWTPLHFLQVRSTLGQTRSPRSSQGLLQVGPCTLRPCHPVLPAPLSFCDCSYLITVFYCHCSVTKYPIALVRRSWFEVQEPCVPGEAQDLPTNQNWNLTGCPGGSWALYKSEGLPSNTLRWVTSL